MSRRVLGLEVVSRPAEVSRIQGGSRVFLALKESEHMDVGFRKQRFGPDLWTVQKVSCLLRSQEV